MPDVLKKTDNTFDITNNLATISLLDWTFQNPFTASTFDFFCQVLGQIRCLQNAREPCSQNDGEGLERVEKFKLTSDFARKTRESLCNIEVYLNKFTTSQMRDVSSTTIENKAFRGYSFLIKQEKCYQE